MYVCMYVCFALFCACTVYTCCGVRTIGGFKGDQGSRAPPNLAPMQQVPGDAIWRLYNLGKLLAAGALPRTPLGELPEPR